MTPATTALGWAVLITSTEWMARRSFERRSHAWLVSYGGLALLALAFGARLRARSGGRPRAGFGRRLKPGSAIDWPGLALATFGYPLGRKLLGDRPSTAPPDGPALELIVIEIVAGAEELTWGAIVEPALGRTITAVLFAAKHVIIDRRWRRSLGLFLFWMGLAVQRRRWPGAALIAHALLNGIAVVSGHRSRRDQF